MLNLIVHRLLAPATRDVHSGFSGHGRARATNTREGKRVNAWAFLSSPGSGACPVAPADRSGLAVDHQRSTLVCRVLCP